ncbi:hypothetical protein [Mycobacterium sp.]|uniref:hypothetical protein n=1 Tax=Mycobacterium sp. TaxID=1785 RepID=UPI003D10C9C0
MTSPEIRLEIDGKPQVTIDNDQEAAALLRSVGRDPAHYDLSRVDDAGDETFFKASDLVQISPGDRFRTRLRIDFTIDGDVFTTHDNEQTVDDLLRLAGLDPNRFDIAKVGEPALDRDELVHIATGDRFVTARRDNPVA